MPSVLSKDPNVALSGLNELASGCAFWPLVLRVLQRITEIETLSPQHASKLAKHIYFLGMRQDAPDSFDSLVHHWDYIDLAIDQIIGTPKDAVDEFVRDVSALVANARS